MNKLKENYTTKIKKFILVPLITTSIMLSCSTLKEKETEKIHNIKNAISFVKKENDVKLLKNAMLMTNVVADQVNYIKEYSQISPKKLKVKRNIIVYDNFSFITRATQDNFIYVSEQEGQIKGYVTLYAESKYNSNYVYNSNESLNFISTSIGELMIKVYLPNVTEEVKLFYNKIISESVISFLYSTKHLTKKESEILINSIWNY